ncbi:CinA family protein [Marinospirillum sp.]|uniref:CinA family protein n=1 Tax=Marinospirillum sp. TaxID=2183934 RepID=UPI00384C8280
MQRNPMIEKLATLALANNWMLATAESCTGGGIAKALTEVAGSSAWFGYGLVTYSNQAKQQLLGVQETSLQAFGAVSEQVVKEMVAGACRVSGADFAVATSGVAGPGGGSAEKPVGTVWLAWGNLQEQQACCCHFSGNRRDIREASIDTVLEQLLDFLEKK